MKTSIAVRVLLVGSNAVLAMSCGGSSTSGATVTVVNRDAMGHSVTSEAARGAYTAGEVAGVAFDTGIFTGTRAFAIAATAPEGTVVPYFCQSHLGTMVTPNGSITIRAGATPGPGPVVGGGGGGYGY